MPLSPSRNRHAAAFILGGWAIFVLIIGLLLFQRSGAERQIRSLIQNTRDVLSDVNELNIVVRDAETGQRGYVLTGRLEYLEPYKAAAKRLNLLLDHLQKGVADNESRRRQLTAIRSLTQRKFSELDETIQLRTNGGEDAAKQVVMSNLGFDLMTGITAALNNLAAEENRDLEERYSTMERVNLMVRLLMAGGSAVSVLFLAAIMMRRSAIRRRDTDREKERQRHELERSNGVLLRMAEQNDAASQYARGLLEASLDPFVTISPLGKITDVNEATIKVTGVPRATLVGTDFAEYFTRPERAREGYERAFSHGSVIDYPLTIRHKNKVLTEVLYNAAIYKDASGDVIGVFACARDVTAQRRAEIESGERRDNELKRLAELEMFQRLTVGRELRMIELKKEILELKRTSRAAPLDGPEQCYAGSPEAIVAV